ncbi:FecR family protein [Echinicola shivajiensis]|uniref:FecR family protein n=1 Tax=Echinicola shivajiensis TaxID=1035916 RepID=UPI001BFC0223|nr:FecR domain-containing protein [Echinicola shivajiensis]
MERKEKVIKLIEKYLSNQSTNEEIDELFEEISKPGNEDLLESSMHEAWYEDEVFSGIDTENQEKLFKRIYNNKAAHLRVSKNNRIETLWKWWGAAAVFLIILLTGWFLLKEAPESDNVLWTEVKADIGERKYLTLPDGSEVWLNAGSKISYQNDFQSRDVELVGEAFFDVKRDEARPFTVQSDGINTRVLGTSFNVRAYSEDNGVKVTVKTGRVAVGKLGAQFASITPNQQIHYSEENQDFTFQEVDASSLASWIGGDLVFENVTFSEAIVTLKMEYGKDFKFDNPSLGKCRFTSKFDVGEDLDHILEVLSTLNGIDYRTEGNTIYFNGKKCI